MTTAFDLHYLAGFFDGEGSIGLYGPHLVLTMQVTGTDEPSIQLYADTFGGKITHRRTRIYNRKEQWLWAITGTRARAALITLEPYLRLKRVQAQHALRAPISARGVALSPPDRALRLEVAQTIRAMHHRKGRLAIHGVSM